MILVTAVRCASAMISSNAGYNHERSRILDPR